MSNHVILESSARHQQLPTLKSQRNSYFATHHETRSLSITIHDCVICLAFVMVSVMVPICPFTRSLNALWHLLTPLLTTVHSFTPAVKVKDDSCLTQNGFRRGLIINHTWQDRQDLRSGQPTPPDVLLQSPAQDFCGYPQGKSHDVADLPKIPPTKKNMY